MWSFSKEESLSEKETKVLEAYLEAIPTDADGLIRLDLLIGFLSNFQKALIENDAAFLEQRRGYKSDRIADIVEFAESAEYLEAQGDLVAIHKGRSLEDLP